MEISEIFLLLKVQRKNPELIKNLKDLGFRI